MKAKYNDIELEGTLEEVAATLRTLALPVMVIRTGESKPTMAEVADKIISGWRLQKAKSLFL